MKTSGDGETEETSERDASPPPPAPAPASKPTKKRSRSPHRDGTGSSDSGAAAAAAQANAAASAIAAAAAAAAAVGLAGMQSVLTSALASSNKSGGEPSASSLGPSGTSGASVAVGGGGAAAADAGFMPSPRQVEIAARKSVAECPPFVHLSSRDCAPQLRVEDGPTGRRLTVRGGMRGYRMARSTHGVAPGAGAYYYEALILEPPGARELVAELPPNVRLGRELRRTVQDLLVEEEMELRRKRRERDGSLSSDTTAGKKKKKPSGNAANAGAQDRQKLLAGHVRIGWSMRTGDLQAPTGFDRWSYGLRDIAGSRVHDSRREDRWGGEPFGPGDVVGFAISLVKDAESSDAASSDKGKPSQTSHIRFFKNGQPMGHFVVSRGVRHGGEAFDRILPGTYYPAVSVYMGGAVRANFGPHFVYPPRSLPSGMKVRPVSELCTPPLEPDEAVESALKERAFPKKAEEGAVRAFREAVNAEATIRRDCYENHARRHVDEVRSEREARGLSTGDLPENSADTKKVEKDDIMDVDVVKGADSKGVEM